MGEELSAIRTGLHDLERKLERIESRITQGAADYLPEPPRARLINFVSSAPPLATPPSIASSASEAAQQAPQFVPPTHSPWLATMSNRYSPPSREGETGNPQSAISQAQSVSHPSQERFGVEEATVAELVEFFESEKKCAVEPGGKPCDHCAMCSSRGF